MSKGLFDSFSIGPCNIANRFVRSATWEGMCDPDGSPTEKLVKLYSSLAAGGVGLIISGYAFVRQDGKQLIGKMGIDKDSLLPGLQRLTGAVHDQGSVVFCQLVHAGGQTNSKMIGKTPLAPSAIDFSSYPERPAEMTGQDIAGVIQAFGKAAHRARKAGFDGVQLHGAHGYLINQFLSPLTNRRKDQYGGALENRMRFLEEIITAVLQRVGSDYPVTIKLTGSDNLAGGFSIAEGVLVAQRLEELGIDAIEVSSGTPASGDRSPVRKGIASPEQEAYNADLAAQIKQAVRIPVGVVGGLRSCPVMQSLLERGQADFFALARPLIREPDLIKRWSTDPGKPATCTSCNGCFIPGLKKGGIYCVLDQNNGI